MEPIKAKKRSLTLVRLFYILENNLTAILDQFPKEPRLNFSITKLLNNWLIWKEPCETGMLLRLKSWGGHFSILQLRHGIVIAVILG